MMMKLIPSLPFELPGPLLLVGAALLSAGPATAQWPAETEGSSAPAIESEPAGVSALLPGVLPADTAPEARALWKALLGAASPSAELGPVKAFDLEFDGRLYQEGQTNDFSGRYRFLEPGFVRTLLTASKRETLRGPDGDWLVFENGRQVKLEGRDYEVDVEELDRAVGVAQSFVALTDPSTIRVQRLELLKAAPNSIPAGLLKKLGALKWLVVHTPDFRLESDPPFGAPGASSNLHRIELGLHPETHLPALAVVRQAALGQRGFESAQLLQLGNFKPLDRGEDYKVPHMIITYGPTMKTSPWSFDLRRPTFDLYVKSGTLRPVLTADHFKP